MIYRVTREYAKQFRGEATEWERVHTHYCGDDLHDARVAYHGNTHQNGTGKGAIREACARTVFERLDEEGLSDSDLGVMVKTEVGDKESE